MNKSQKTSDIYNRYTVNQKQKLRMRKVKRVRFTIVALIIFTAALYINKNYNVNILSANEIYNTKVILVNKNYLLNAEYIPKDLVKVDIEFLPESTEEEKYMTEEAAEALRKLVEGAAEDGIILKGLSGYRSYETQRTLYNYNVEVNGKEYADNYVAPPGGSEHQLGEAMDLGTQWGWITEGCPEAQWMAMNAYRYGFIVRYESGKEDITGYNYEPWHIRYVGKQLAEELYNNNITLEEYEEYMER